jgi:hypothetical protein
MKILILQFSTVNNSLQRHETINLPASSAGRAKAGNQRATPCTVSRGPFRRPQAIGRPTQATAAAGAPDALRRPRSPRPCCGCRSLARSLRDAPGKKQPLLPHSPLGVSGFWPARPPRGYSPLAFPRHPSLGWTPTRGKCPPSPPSGAFRAFRYYTGAIIRGRGREGGAPSIPKSLPPTPIPLLTAGCGGARLRAG